MDLEPILSWLAEFWKGNSGSILASLIVGLIFFVLGPIGLWFSGRRIRDERIRKAKEMLIDLVEGMLVNQEVVTPDKLLTLLRAVEREIDVDLEASYSLDWLFEDILLRFQRSKHLDAQQKNDYAKRLWELGEQSRKAEEQRSRRPLPRRLGAILEELQESEEPSSSTRNRELLEELESRVRKDTAHGPIASPLSLYVRLYRKNPRLFLLLSVLFLALYILFVRYAVLR